MSHWLEPFEGQPYLDPDDIVSRLRIEFACVEADRDEGDNIVGDTIAKLIELNAPQGIIDKETAARSRSEQSFLEGGRPPFASLTQASSRRGPFREVSPAAQVGLRFAGKTSAEVYSRSFV